MDFKKTCLLLKDAEVSKIFYDRGIIQNTSEAIATTQTLNEKVATTKDDYIKMFYYSITRIKNTFIFFRYASCFILKLSLGAPFSRRSDISIF